jgi:pimeloyl-ACP methyl ester carboxylesterase
MSQTARISRPDGAQIAAECQGDANRPALLLSNSLATTRTLWEPLMPALLNAFCVVRYDTRGHGESTTPNDHATLVDLADDAVAVLDHFQIQKALMVGISLGGMTALTLALYQPSRLTGVLACNCRSGVDDAGRAAWAQRVDIALNQGMNALIQPTIPTRFSRCPSWCDGDRCRHDPSHRSKRVCGLRAGHHRLDARLASKPNHLTHPLCGRRERWRSTTRPHGSNGRKGARRKLHHVSGLWSPELD